MTDALAGLKVLDFSRVLAGPFAGRMLCDLGADVVKVEPPEGDVTRLWGKEIGGIRGYFNQQNAGKRNLSVNLGEADGVALVKRLVAEADVLIENFRPDVMGRLGLSYEVLKEINPRLIMLSISGFGAGNEQSRRAAYAPIVHAEVGIVDRQATIYGSHPADMALSVADTNASLHGLVGLLTALLHRQATGEGEHVEISMVDATMVTNDGMHYALDQVRRPPPNEVFTTSAGNLMIAGDFRFIWHQLKNVVGLQDGLAEEVSLEEKIATRRALANKYFNETLTTREEVIAALDKMNLAWGDVRDMGEIVDLPSVKARGSVVEIDDRAGGTRPVPQSPYRFENISAYVRGGSAHLGEHNSEVLKDWLGLSAGEVETYRDVLVHDE